MLQYFTFLKDKTEDKTNLSSGTRVTIIHEAACDSEIKIEDEVIRHYDYKENVDNSSISPWKRCTDVNQIRKKNHFIKVTVAEYFCF